MYEVQMIATWPDWKRDLTVYAIAMLNRKVKRDKIVAKAITVYGKEKEYDIQDAIYLAVLIVKGHT